MIFLHRKQCSKEYCGLYKIIECVELNNLITTFTKTPCNHFKSDLTSMRTNIRPSSDFTGSQVE